MASRYIVEGGHHAAANLDRRPSCDRFEQYSYVIEARPRYQHGYRLVHEQACGTDRDAG
jgi:hypothetical protein